MSVTYVSAELRTLVHERANGYCEYCRIAERLSFECHQIDHVIAEKHEGRTDEDNLALSCTLCNAFKGSDIASIDPESGEIVRLFNPRIDDWNENFSFDLGSVVGKTPSARATVRLLKFNRFPRIEERLS